MEYKISSKNIWHDEKLNMFICHNEFNNTFYASYDECCWIGGSDIKSASMSYKNYMKITDLLRLNIDVNPNLYRGYYKMFQKQKIEDKIIFVTNYEEL